MPLNETKTMVQCYFDGTVTEKDVSFLLLDHFGSPDWRKVHAEYLNGKITVGEFNARVFARVTADKQTLIDFLTTSGKVQVKPGLKDIVRYCADNGVGFTIVSNGLRFYIETVLKSISLDNIEIFAAETTFTPEGMVVKYVGPDGSHNNNGFKEWHTRLYTQKGYRVIYLGNGISDLPAARRAHHTFATGDLKQLCRENNVGYTPFEDFHDVIKGFKLLNQG